MPRPLCLGVLTALFFCAAHSSAALNDSGLFGMSHQSDRCCANNPGSEDSFRRYVLGHMRIAWLRARAEQKELAAIGVALNRRTISADMALELMDDTGLLDRIGPNDCSVNNAA